MTRLAVVDLDRLPFEIQWAIDAADAIEPGHIVLRGETLRHLAALSDEREREVVERLAEMGVSVPLGTRVPIGARSV